MQTCLFCNKKFPIDRLKLARFNGKRPRLKRKQTLASYPGALYAYNCGFETLCAQLQIPGTDSLSPHEIANMINVAFLEPMQTYQSIDPPPPFESIPDLSQISVEAVSSILKKLPHKAPGPDGIPN